MSGNSRETLEHLVTGDLEATRGLKSFRQEGAPNRMRVKHRTGSHLPSQHRVQ